jgi:hypothetical protein
VKDKIPFHVRPMFATVVGEPFLEPGLGYEEKYDGVRILPYKEDPTSRCSAGMTGIAPKASQRLRSAVGGLFGRPLCCSTEISLRWTVTSEVNSLHLGGRPAARIASQIA